MAANYQMLFELNAALGGGFASAFSQGSQQIDNMKNKLDALNAAGSTGDLLGGVSAALQSVGAIKGLEAAYETLKECAQASIEFESAMTGVSKTTDMSASELQAMSEAVMKLSTEIPVTTTELANVMEVAGQLGIHKEDLLDFSTVMSQLSTATTMTADEAATMLAQFANITQMDPSKYSNLASAVVDLGNNYATTEQKIVDMGQGIAAAASLAGMSEADMMGLSAAVTSLGIETAAGSTSMSKLISKLNTAVETGDGLQEFASVAGMSAQQFSDAWGNDAANALASFITGLNDVERNGASATVILSELGITETRMQRMVLSLAGSGTLMSEAIKTANDAFRENTALTAEAEKRYATTESRLTMLSNAANNVQIAIGDALTPAVGFGADMLTGMIEPLAEFIEQNPAIVQGLTAMVGVLGAATAAVGAYTAATKLASAANLLFGGSIPGVGLIAGLSLAVGGLVFGISSLADAYNDAHPSLETLGDDFKALSEQAKKQQSFIDLADEYKSLTKDIDKTQASMKFKAELDVGNVSRENLDILEELKSHAESNTYELEQHLRLIGFDDDVVAGMGYGSYKEFVDDVVAGKVVVNENGTITEKLDLGGVAPDDLTLIKEIAENNGYVVSEDGVVTQELDVGKVNPKDLQTLEKLKQNISNDEAKLVQVMELTGIEDLTQDKLNRYLQLKVNTADGDHALRQMLEVDASNATPYQVNQMKNFIRSIQNKNGKAVQTLSAIVNEDQIKALGYSTLEDFTAAVLAGKVVISEAGVVSQTIDVSGDVADLKAAWENENALAEAEAAEAAAAEDLAGKKERLNDITQALRDSSDGFISATDEETDALNRQIEAYQRIQEAELEVTKSRIKENINSQSDAYVKSMQNVEAARKRAAEAEKAYNTALQWEEAGVDALKGRIVELSTEMQNLARENAGGDLSSVTAFQDARAELEGIIELVTGIDKNYAPGAWDMMIRDANNLNIEQSDLRSALLAASNTWKYYETNVKEAGASQNIVLESMIQAVSDGTMDAKELEETLTEAFSNYENCGEIVSSIMSDVTAGVEAAKAAATGSGSTAQAEADQAVAAVGNVIARMEELKAAYEEAKKSALASLNGRFSLFGEVGDSAESKTAEQMKANMTAQQNYWEQYDKNLQAVLSRGLAPEIAKQLADGSAESAATLQTLADEAKTSAEDIQKINDTFESVEASKEALASTIADMETNFTEGMNALQTELENTVAEMEMGSEAAEAATATMEAYVAAIEAQAGPAGAAGDQVASAVNEALATIEREVDIHIGYSVDPLPSLPKIGGGSTYPKNAIGSDYAAEGLHLVGEEGPELVYMGGGEKILTAHETVNALSGSGASAAGNVELSFQTTYNINGGNPEDIRRVLEEHDADLRGQIESVMEDINTDRMRTRYS